MEQLATTHPEVKDLRTVGVKVPNQAVKVRNSNQGDEFHGEAFAVVVTVGVLVSLFVSLTLTPMLSSRYLQVKPSQFWLSKKLETFFNGLDANYTA